MRGVKRGEEGRGLAFTAQQQTCSACRSTAMLCLLCTHPPHVVSTLHSVGVVQHGEGPRYPPGSHSHIMQSHAPGTAVTQQLLKRAGWFADELLVATGQTPQGASHPLVRQEMVNKQPQQQPFKAEERTAGCACSSSGRAGNGESFASDSNMRVSYFAQDGSSQWHSTSAMCSRANHSGGRGSGPGRSGAQFAGRMAVPMLGLEDCISRHPFKLCSAYASVLGQEPAWTSCHRKYKGTLDYMFYQQHSAAGGDAMTLTPRRVLQMPDGVPHGLPSWGVPSDHVSLLVEFALHH